MLPAASQVHVLVMDTETNDNFRWSLADERQERLDRLYLCSTGEEKCKPQGFTLVGTDRVPGVGMFPSDHYGIYVEFVC